MNTCLNLVNTNLALEKKKLFWALLTILKFWTKQI